MNKFTTLAALVLMIPLGAAASAALGTPTDDQMQLPMMELQLAQAGAAEQDPAALAALIEEGAPLFRRNCASCHGTAGEGGIGPRLAGSTKMASETLILNQVLFGSEYMPAFNQQLGDHEIAAIATLVRNSWGNAYPVVEDAAVAALRAQ